VQVQGLVVVPRGVPAGGGGRSLLVPGREQGVVPLWGLAARDVQSWLEPVQGLVAVLREGTAAGDVQFLLVQVLVQVVVRRGEPVAEGVQS
jgi:hypothetical protein